MCVCVCVCVCVCRGVGGQHSVVFMSAISLISSYPSLVYTPRHHTSFTFTAKPLDNYFNVAPEFGVFSAFLPNISASLGLHVLCMSRK